MYTKLEYNKNRTEKINSEKELKEALEKALNLGFDTVKRIDFYRQPNGLFMGRSKEIFYKKGSWRTK